MGAGNVKVLKKTLDSFKDICDEVIYGDLLIFKDDREIIKSYQEEYNLRIVPFKFDYLFKNGFSPLLNELSFHASNDLVIYMNTSEAILTDHGILSAVKQNPDCNTFYFDHSTDPHRWYRMYNKNELKWSGRIHEELQGEYRPYHKPVFTMQDYEKDLDNPFKAVVLNSLKECVYFHNYMSIVDHPETLGATNQGWVQFAKENYDSMKERLIKKGKQYEAMLEGGYKKFMLDIYSNPDFEKQRYDSSNLIEFQGSPMFLGKK